MAIWPDDPSLAGSILLGFADATVKATVVLSLACLAVRSLKRSSAAVRHRVWALSSPLLLSIPALSWLAPGWQIPVWVERSQPVSRVSIGGPRSVESFPEVPPAPVSAPSPVVRERSDGFAPPSIAPSRGWTVAEGLILLWAFGFVAVVMPTLAAIVGNEWRRRRSRRVDDPGWLDLLEALRDQSAIRRRVELRFADGSMVPMTWGIVRPVISIPSDAGAWSDSTRRVVLLHELAHVARFDVGHQLLGRFAVALYWFHPLAWLALGRMRLECEHACDDRVLGAGVPPSDYADQLLTLARTFRTPRFAMGLALARTNTLEARMTALFDASRSHTPLPRSTARKMGLLAGLLLLTLSIIHPGPSVARPEPTPALDPDSAQAPTPPVEAKGRIEGRVVVDSDGTAVGGAKVILFGPPPRARIGYDGRYPLIYKVADAGGAFAFEGLRAGSYRLRAYRDGLTSQTRMTDWESVEVPEAGVGPKPVDFRLKPGMTWTVRIKSKATGLPIPGATAYLRGYVDDFTADAEGVARVRPLTAERHHAEIWADGFAKVKRWVDLEDNGAAEAEVFLEPGGSIAGVVRDSSGRTLDRVRISVTSPKSSLAITVVESVENGRYRVDHLPVDESLDMQLVKESYKDIKRVIRAKPAEQTFDFDLAPRTDGGSVAGIVVDQEGRPVVGPR